MRKIITFLGKYPRETQYQYKDHAYHGRVFAEALHQFIDYDQMLVFVTKAARENAWFVLQELQDPRITAIDIPIGRDEEGIWEIFAKVVETVHAGDEVVFDITHGLRSMPFLVFLFAAYLKSVRNAAIAGIYYGAFELADSEQGIPAPVFDLSEFVSMLDWITAGDQFIRTGDAHWMAELMRSESRAFKNLTINLEKVAKANAFCNPFDLMENAYRFNTTARNLKKNHSNEMRPFWAIQPALSEEMDQLALSPKQSEDDQAKVEKEIRIIAWYIQHHQYIQASLLMRETLLDMVSLHLEQPLDYRNKYRSAIEWAVSGLNRIGRTFYEDGQSYEFTPAHLNEFGRKIHDHWPEAGEIRDLGQKLQRMRNTFAHAAHQGQPFHLKAAQTEVLEIFERIKVLALSWQLIQQKEESA